MPLLSTRGAASARGFGLLGRVKAITDPFFNYVTMLLHGDGTNGAQNSTFLDSSTNNFTITRNGNTTQGSFSPYGPNWSNYFGPTGSYLVSSAGTALQLTNSDFTLEFWALGPGTTGTAMQLGSGTEDWSPVIGYPLGANLTIYLSSTASSWDVASGVSMGTLPNNTWAHYAITRSGSTFRTFKDGTLVSTFTSSASLYQVSNQVTLGRAQGGTNSWNGYLSNVRLVKGSALYTANFTPSTTPLTAVSGTSLLACQSNRFIDNSSNNFTLTPTGSPSVQRFSPFAPTAAYSTATIGGSGYFDGAGDYLSCGSQTAYAVGTGNFTAELWFYPTNITATSYSTLINTRSGAVNDSSAWVVSYTSSGSAIFYSDGFLITSATGLITNNQWFHIALVRNGNTATLYLNGISIGTANISAYDFTRNELSVGANNNGSEPIQQAYIANVRLVKGTAVYTSNFTPPTAPLTAIANTSLLLNMTNGAIFDNAMMNDLETVGNAQISTSVVKYGTGSIGGFNGSSQLISYAGQNVGNFGSGNFTVEFWINTNTSSGSPGVVTQASAGGAANTSWGVFLGYTSSTSIDVYLSNGSSYFANTGGGNVTDGAWHHIAFCRSGSSGRLFVDGVQVGSTLSLSTTTLGNGTRQINVGGQGSGLFMTQGFIDDLRITKGVARYTTNFTPPTAAFPNN